MRRHGEQLTWDVVIWPGRRIKIYTDELNAAGITTPEIDPRVFSADALYPVPEARGADEGGRYTVVREADMHVRILRDHDSGDVDRWERSL